MESPAGPPQTPWGKLGHPPQPPPQSLKTLSAWQPWMRLQSLPSSPNLAGEGSCHMLPPPASCMCSKLEPWDELVVTAPRPTARLGVSQDPVLCWSRTPQPLPCGVACTGLKCAVLLQSPAH